jgi:hypothetical protein
MGLTLKICGVNVAAAKKMYEDIGQENFRTYTTASFSVTQLTNVHPDSLLRKCVGVHAAFSCDPDGDRVWLGLMPFRVDRVPHGVGALELQGDITVLVYAGDHTTPATTGIAIYHLNSEGQNVPLVQYETLTREQATELLRLGVKEGTKPLQHASTQFRNALVAAVERARPYLTGEASEPTA